MEDDGCVCLRPTDRCRPATPQAIELFAIVAPHLGARAAVERLRSLASHKSPRAREAALLALEVRAISLVTPYGV